MSSTLIAHKGGIIRTRDELAGLSTPAATATWKPIPHAELVGSLLEGLDRHGDIVVTRERYCTMGKDDARLFGALDLRIDNLDEPDFTLALALRTSNDQSLAIEFMAAARVFVCDNNAFSGSGSVVLNRKHTSGLDLGREIPPAIESYLDKAGAFRLDIDRMKNTGISDPRAKELLYDAFSRSTMPLRLFGTVDELYFRDEAQTAMHPDRTLWGLSQAFTEAIKSLPVGSQQQRGVKVGRYFGRLLAHLTNPKADVLAN